MWCASRQYNKQKDMGSALLELRWIKVSVYVCHSVVSDNKRSTVITRVQSMSPRSMMLGLAVQTRQGILALLHDTLNSPIFTGAALCFAPIPRRPSNDGPLNPGMNPGTHSMHRTRWMTVYPSHGFNSLVHPLHLQRL